MILQKMGISFSISTIFPFGYNRTVAVGGKRHALRINSVVIKQKTGKDFHPPPFLYKNGQAV